MNVDAVIHSKTVGNSRIAWQRLFWAWMSADCEDKALIA